MNYLKIRKSTDYICSIPSGGKLINDFIMLREETMFVAYIY